MLFKNIAFEKAAGLFTALVDIHTERRRQMRIVSQ